MHNKNLKNVLQNYKMYVIFNLILAPIIMNYNPIISVEYIITQKLLIRISI